MEYRIQETWLQYKLNLLTPGLVAFDFDYNWPFFDSSGPDIQRFERGPPPFAAGGHGKHGHGPPSFAHGPRGPSPGHGNGKGRGKGHGNNGNHGHGHGNNGNHGHGHGNFEHYPDCSEEYNDSYEDMKPITKR